MPALRVQIPQVNALLENFTATKGEVLQNQPEDSLAYTKASAALTRVELEHKQIEDHILNLSASTEIAMDKTLKPAIAESEALLNDRKADTEKLTEKYRDGFEAAEGETNRLMEKWERTERAFEGRSKRGYAYAQKSSPLLEA